MDSWKINCYTVNIKKVSHYLYTKGESLKKVSHYLYTKGESLKKEERLENLSFFRESIMINKAQFGFYEIDIDYLKYLNECDSEVYYNLKYKKDLKPFIGIILLVNEF